MRTSSTTPVWISGGLRLDDNYLVAIGPDRFWQPAISTPVQFIRDSVGKVIAIEQGEPGAAARWPKVR